MAVLKYKDPTTGKFKPYLPIGSDYHIYSTEEKVVGEWIDGKPLYEVTIDLTLGNYTHSHDYDISNYLPNNIKEIVRYEGYIVFTSKNSATCPYISSDGGSNVTLLIINFRSLRVDTGELNRSGCKLYSTIRYTKTTETPSLAEAALEE